MTLSTTVTDTFIASGGARLRSKRWEARDPRGRILLIHGLGEHGGRYARVGRFFAAQGFSVFTYDQRGHGGSEGRRGHVPSFDTLLEDLSLATDELQRTIPGDEPPFYYGHSLGGLVLLRFLQVHRPRTLGSVVSAPWLGTAVEVPAWKRLAARLLYRFAPDVTLTTDLDAAGLCRDPAIQRAYDADPLVHRRISPRLFREVEQAQARSLEEGMDPAVPVLVLVPGADPITDLGLTTRWAESLGGQGVESIFLDGLLHEPHNEPEWEQVLERVLEWMTGRLGATGSGEGA